MKLSIIILFCDTDYLKLKTLVNLLHMKIRVEHEIICVDNREEFKDVELNIKNCKIISKGRNLYQSEGRKFGFESSCGKYIWYIDCDDNTPIVTDNDFDEDIIIYRLKCKNGVSVYDYPYYTNKVGGVYYDNLVQIELDENSHSLWNKWIKREILEKVFDNYWTKEENYINNEDFIIGLASAKFAKSIRFSQEYVYVYDITYSNASAPNMNYVRFAKTIYGIDAALDKIKAILNNDKQFSKVIHNEFTVDFRRISYIFEKNEKNAAFELLKQSKYYKLIV